MKKRDLISPPIIESVIDFRTTLPPNVSIKEMENAFNEIKDQFPKKSPMYFFEHKLKIQGEQPSTSSTNRPVGFRFDSEDGSEVVQFRLNGFTYNHLKQYPGWKRVYESALTLWETYKKFSSPLDIHRVAIRTINKLKFPCQKDEIKDYISVFPNLPECFPSASSFDMQIKLDVNNINAVITEKVIDDYDKLFTTILFDTDIFLDKLSIKANDTKLIQDTLENLRQAKNDLFFNSITDKGDEHLK